MSCRIPKQLENINRETLTQLFILATIVNHESGFRKHCTPMRKMIYVSLSTYRVNIQFTAMITKYQIMFRVFQIDEVFIYIYMIYISWKLYLINEHPRLIQNDF